MPRNRQLLEATLAAIVLATTFLGVLVTWETPLGSLKPIDVSVLAWTLISLPRIYALVQKHKISSALFLLSFVWMTITTSLFSSNELIGFAYIGRWFVTLLAAWSLSDWVSKQDTNTHRWIDLGAIAWIGVGIGQYLLFPDARILFWIGWDDHLFRAFGSVLDPLFYGLATSALAWRGFRRWQLGESTGQWLLIIALIGVTFSFSRLAVLATLGWLFLESFGWKKLKQAALAGCTLFVLVLLAPKDGGGEGQRLLRTQSLVARGEAVQSDVSQDRSDLSLIIGEGWYTRPANSDATIPSNAQIADTLALQIWLSGGVMAVILFLLTTLVFQTKSKILWWNVLCSVVSLMSLSPWVLIASGLVQNTREK